jgi:hypothetical protein
MDTGVTLSANAGSIEGWLREIGTHPVPLPAPYANWQFEIDYPPNSKHKIVVFNSSAQPRALVVATRVAFSQEHIAAFALMENADKWRFMRDLQSALNREFVEFGFEQPQPAGPLTCPTFFSVTATRFDDSLSLDGLARAVSSVYKAEFAGVLIVQDQLGGGNYGGSGGDFPFRVRSIQ